MILKIVLNLKKTKTKKPAAFGSRSHQTKGHREWIKKYKENKIKKKRKQNTTNKQTLYWCKPNHRIKKM